MIDDRIYKTPSLVFLRESEAANLFNVSRQTVHNWAARGIFKKEKLNTINYYVAKLCFNEDGSMHIETFPEPTPEPIRKMINVTTQR